MSRELSNLKDEGFINIKGKKITILYKWSFYYFNYFFFIIYSI
jgi:hypothetical protein